MLRNIYFHHTTAIRSCSADSERSPRRAGGQPSTAAGRGASPVAGRGWPCTACCRVRFRPVCLREAGWISRGHRVGCGNQSADRHTAAGGAPHLRAGVTPCCTAVMAACRRFRPCSLLMLVVWHLLDYQPRDVVSSGGCDDNGAARHRLAKPRLRSSDWHCSDGQPPLALRTVSGSGDGRSRKPGSADAVPRHDAPPAGR